MSSKTPSSSSVAQARRTVQQLRREARIDRIKVSPYWELVTHICSIHLGHKVPLFFPTHNQKCLGFVCILCPLLPTSHLCSTLHWVGQIKSQKATLELECNKMWKGSVWMFFLRWCGLIGVFVQVSKASSDLMRYCGEHAKNDPLLMGIPTSENPFKEKKPCTVL